MSRVNLMPARRIWVRKRRKRLARWMYACSLSAVLAVGACMLSLLIKVEDVGGMAVQIRTVSGQIEQSKQAIARIQGQLVAAQQDLEATEALGPHPDWSILLALVASRTGDQVVLRHCSLLTTREVITPGSDVRDSDTVFHLRIDGYGRSQSAVSDFALRLEETSILDAVTFVTSKREPFLTGHAIAFQLQCAIRGGRTDS